MDSLIVHGNRFGEWRLARREEKNWAARDIDPGRQKSATPNIQKT
jgi:hypothetical protein